MTSIEQLFRSELDSYDRLRAECLSSVAKWVYSTEEIWCIEPDREHVMRPGSVLPGPTGARRAWGYDQAGRIVVMQLFRTIKAYGKPPATEISLECFVRHSPNAITVSRFLGTRLQILSHATQEAGKTVELEECQDYNVNSGGSIDCVCSLTRYRWEGGVLKSSISVNDQGRPTSETIYDWENKTSLLYYIRRDGSRRLSGQPVPQGLTVNSLLATVRKRLLVVIPEVVAAAHITEPVYALALTYDGEGNDLLPPFLEIGFEAQRATWTAKKIKGRWVKTWNSGEHKSDQHRHIELDDEELIEACEYLSRLFEQGASQAPAKKFLLNIAAELGKMDWTGKLNPTPDFIVFAVDFEMADLKKNLKACVPPERLAALETGGYL
jgi:hypothetical protein